MASGFDCSGDFLIFVSSFLTCISVDFAKLLIDEHFKILPIQVFRASNSSIFNK